MEIVPVLEIAPGADPTDPSTWIWEDITADARGTVSVKRGRADEEARPTSSTMSITLDNADGKYARLNPDSPYFGRLALNTPIRSSLRRAADAFGRTVANGWGTADTGQAWGIADATLDPATFSVASGRGQLIIDGAGFTAAHPAATLTGLAVRDIEVRGRIRATAVATGGTYTAGLVARYVDISNYLYARVQFETDGTVSIDLQSVVGGTATSFTATADTGYTYTAGAEFHVRTMLYRSRMSAKAWPVGGQEPAWQVEAEVPAVSPRRGAVGCSASRFSASTNVDLPVQFDDIEVLSIRFTGFVSEWPPHVGGPNEAEVAIAASGALRRLQRGEGYSAARWTIDSLDPYLYWPMEDPSGSESFASAVPGRPDGALVRTQRADFDSQPRLAADAGAAGSDALPVFQPVVAGHFPAVGDMVGLWTIAYAQRLDITDDALTAWEVDTFGIYAGDSNTEIEWATTGITIHGTFPLEYLWDDAFTPDVEAWNTIVVQLDVPASGAWTATIIVNGTPLITGSVNTNPPTLGRLRHFYAPAQTSSQVDISIGHIAIWEGHPDIAQTYHRAVIDGFAGETAEERLARLDDTGRVATAIATPTHPEATDAMGPQQIGAIPDILDEIEQTNRGLAFEGLDGALTMVSRADLYAAADADPITADALTGIRPGLEIQDDDQGIVNTATAKNASGAQRTVTDAASVAVIGVYPDAVQVNTLDDENQLTNYAGWEVARSDAALEHERYPAVPLNLNGDETLLEEWLAEDPIGRALYLTDIADVSPGTKRQLIEGYAESWDAEQANADANCTPLAAWEAVTLGDADTGRIDTAGSTLAAGLVLPGATGAYASTPSTVALQFTGDLDVRVEVTRDSWAAPAAEEVMTARYRDSTNQRSWRFSYDTTGVLRFVWSADGITPVTEFSSAPPLTDLEAARIALGVTRSAATGDVTFWTATNLTGTWTQLGTVQPGATGPMHAGTAALEAGARNGGTTPWTGQIHALEVRSGIGGTLVSDTDFTALLNGATSFIDGTGGTWTVAGAATIAGALSLTDTQLKVFSDAEAWTTAAGDLPFNIRIGGEAMTVTAVTGTTSTQTFTVIRGVDDYTSTHAAGIDVRLARTPRVVL